jgi:hypothetical protein
VAQAEVAFDEVLEAADLAHALQQHGPKMLLSA